VQAATPFPEYNAQRGLSLVNVLPAWDKATGQGIVIAIVDSGVRLTHEDLKSQLVSTGYDFVNHDNFANDDSISGHGTGLAGVAAAARNGVGIVGVAYDAKILPVKVRNAQRVREPDLTTLGIDYATTHGANVINLSLPGDFKENIAEAIVRATDAGVIVTMAAGNVAGGGPEFPAYLVANPQLKGRAIAVGSINPATGKISDFSNRAGTRMDYYLVAPGENVLTTSNKNDHSYEAMGGTSFAAPHVAGAAALLLQLFPNIPPETIVQILLDTATDLGAPGVDEVYGHGLLNVGAAVSPQGTVAVPGSGGGSDNGAAIAIGALALGGAVGYAILHNSKDAEQALILDKYGRGYSINLAKATTVRDPQTDLAGLVQNMDREFNGLTMPISGNLTAHLYYSTPRESIYRSMSPD
jgi:subtilisin family serine protease